jgi:hypothetical protein
MPTAKESLRKQVDQLSEEEAQEILGLISARGSRPVNSMTAKVTREVVRARLANRPASRVPLRMHDRSADANGFSAPAYLLLNF